MSVKEKLVQGADYLASKFGYYQIKPDNKDLIDKLSTLLSDKISQVNGLLKTLGDFQEQHEADQVVIASLIALSGEESIELKLDFLKEIASQRLVPIHESTETGIQITLVTDKEDEEICDNCGDIIEDCDGEE